jgi:hypothetical protein
VLNKHLGDLAFGDGYDADAGECQMLLQSGDLRLVTAQSVQGFRQHDVEVAGRRISQ